MAAKILPEPTEINQAQNQPINGGLQNQITLMKGKHFQCVETLEVRIHPEISQINLCFNCFGG